MSEELNRFLDKHFLGDMDDTRGYYLALGIYYMYLNDAMEQAERVEDGEIFDETEIAVLLLGVKTAFEAVDFFKKRLGLEFKSFDITELITLQGCTLEKGKIKGDTGQAVSTARMWLRHFFNNKNDLFRYGKQLSKQDVGRFYFLYEVGVYILFLCREEVDYNVL